MRERDRQQTGRGDTTGVLGKELDVIGNVKQLRHDGRSGERIGLVLSGGAARGAYEMGVLSVLVPALQRRGAAQRSSWERAPAR